jgi:chemotaxis protein CheD
MEFNLINVGIAELGIAEESDILRTILGSCVGICLHDPESKIGGLAHIMLPEKKSHSSNEKKYADTAIPLLIEDMVKKGAISAKITAKIIGGARMFKVSENSIMGEIGDNNINKVKEVLKNKNIKILAEDVGKDYGRTIDFYVKDGMVKIKSLGQEEKII